MIFTKEPANKVFVFVTAYRGHESQEVNEKMLKGLIKTIRTYPGAYGNIRDEHVQGCFKEAGMPEATQERTLKVECTEKQAAELTWLACKTYSQDAVLVVNSQTHTAALWSIEDVGEYPQADLKHYRWLLSLGRPHDYLMIHLAHTYHTRKRMYNDNRMS